MSISNIDSKCHLEKLRNCRTYLIEQASFRLGTDTNTRAGALHKFLGGQVKLLQIKDALPIVSIACTSHMHEKHAYTGGSGLKICTF